uniref:sarcosine oxidase subunit delta n=1 Tax=Pararhizobium sp. IMCC3301 TaxID=3067904 RepID=UPI00274228BF|nr:sarcosine oxidase subunit delta [Pararhizobium sp. IMCC3301]
MLIPCPHCGARDLAEYTYLGDATVKRPAPEKARTRDWENFIYNRSNPRGPHKELWQHNGGCRLVLEMTRDTATHEILAVKSRDPHQTGGGR